MREHTTDMDGRRHDGPHAKGLSAFRLKTIAALFAALSVVAVTVLPALLGAPSADNMTSLTAVVLCDVVSWCAIPIYAWLLVEGWRHTHDVWRYGVRLFVVAKLAEVPYDFIMTGRWFDLRVQNPVYGLLIALIVLGLFDWAGKRLSGVSLVVVDVLFAAVGVLWNLLLHVGVDQRVMFGGVLTLAFALVFRYLGRHENTMMFTAGLLGAVNGVIPALGVVFLHYRNDELGYGHPWTRWVFYALYPVMLALGALSVAVL
ncbi:TraX family protein [Bifidobacterium leontopitheci]|uniref:ABC transporter permease n=1 Tax=Bifidobacterium leontopitheci TaxID=2650774 RepID=A0A6I1GNK2_9BIFI|nr:TraX family protein [Bifidobacterium leontopitheci]KAB7789628.1 ABC transporter permease [Bifidobacterium leontopitheci]